MASARQFESVLEYLAFLIRTVESQPTAEDIGTSCQEIARYYRALGLFHLLLEANTDTFFHTLIQSGLTWKYYLTRSRDEGFTGADARVASFVGPLADAVAANQLGLAAELAELAPTEFREGLEYEEDFAHARFLGGLLQGDSDEQLDAGLSSLEIELDAHGEARLAVCRALLSVDQDAFDAAFPEWLAERDELLLKPSAPELEWDFEVNRAVLVEGLALLRLAEARGLATTAEYPACPSLARRTDYARFEPAAFPYLSLDGGGPGGGPPGART